MRKKTNRINSQSTTNSPVKVTSGRVNNLLYSKSPISPALIRAAVQAGHKLIRTTTEPLKRASAGLTPTCLMAFDSRLRAAICFRRSLERISLLFQMLQCLKFYCKNKRHILLVMNISIRMARRRTSRRRKKSCSVAALITVLRF